MRNVPLVINQTFFLNNKQEADLTDKEVADFVAGELRRRPVRVKHVNRDGVGHVCQIEIDVG